MLPTDCLRYEVIQCAGGFQGLATITDDLRLHSPRRPTKFEAHGALLACLDDREVWAEHGDTIARALDTIGGAQTSFHGSPFRSDTEDLLLDLIDQKIDSVSVEDPSHQRRMQGKRVGRYWGVTAETVLAEVLFEDLSERATSLVRAANAYAEIMSDPRAVAAQRSAPMTLLWDQIEQVASLLWVRSEQLSCGWVTAGAPGGLINKVSVAYPDGCPPDVIENEAWAFASDPDRVARFLVLQGVSDWFAELPGTMRRVPAPSRRFPEWVWLAPAA